jgi:hypothetical protein
VGTGGTQPRELQLGMPAGSDSIIPTLIPTYNQGQRTILGVTIKWSNAANDLSVADMIADMANTVRYHGMRSFGRVVMRLTAFPCTVAISVTREQARAGLLTENNDYWNTITTKTATALASSTISTLCSGTRPLDMDSFDHTVILCVSVVAARLGHRRWWGRVQCGQV